VLCSLLEDERYDVDTEVAGVLAALSRDGTGRATMLEAGAVGFLAEILEDRGHPVQQGVRRHGPAPAGWEVPGVPGVSHVADITLPLDMLTRAESYDTQGQGPRAPGFPPGLGDGALPPGLMENYSWYCTVQY